MAEGGVFRPFGGEIELTHAKDTNLLLFLFLLLLKQRHESDCHYESDALQLRSCSRTSSGKAG